ncbi:SurA N-terminal domain-containing protein [Halomonas sp. TRM85114]|uniref:SurA N-terminal domain-containing protein n=1 Tax=Halomonas jincaotanensis TaxID=2810616 RepID=UPI001BD5E606|nr:SurA N-terminal domain-containing protein [Halomonas jincaotanensis]MBS9404719.1 SurA N-terminal domain-containing protein [Halomonas jincaotanensis]
MHSRRTLRSRRVATLGASLALVLCLTALPLASLAQSNFESLERQSLDRIVAVVNDGAIMASDLEERVAQTRSQLEARDESLPPERVLREQMLDRMIVEEIQLQMARESGLSVDDTDLNRQMRSIAEGNGMSLEQFADAVEADGLTFADVREQIRREMLLSQVQRREIGGRVNISDSEVERFMEEQGATREQARQALFQRQANEELDVWMQEIRSRAFIDNRLAER